MLMWNILYSLIFLSSVLFFPEDFNGTTNFNDAFWIPKEAAFISLAMVTIASSFFLKEAKTETFRNKWIGAILIWAAVSFTFIFLGPLMFNNPNGTVQWNIWNFRPTLNLFLGIFLLITLVENTDDMKRWINISKFLCYLGAAFSVYALLQWVGIDPVFVNNGQFIFSNGQATRNAFMVTTMGNKELTSNFIAIISPLCLMFKDLRFKIFYFLMFLAIFLSDSTISMAGFFGALLLYFLMTKRIKYFLAGVVLLGIVVASSCFLFPEFLSSSGRLGMWSEVLPKFFSSDISYFGGGLGNFPATRFKVRNLLAVSAHNEFIQILWEGGILSLFLVLGYLFTLTGRVLSTWINHNSFMLICFFCGLVSFLIISVGAFPLRIAPMALIGLLYIAGLEVMTRRV